MSSSDDDSNSNTLKQREKTISANTIKIIKEYGKMMIIIPISVFTFGVLGLYMTKIAQANILPTDPDNAPFTSKICGIDSAPIYYNFLSSGDESYGQPMFFDHEFFLETYKTDSIICWLKKRADLATKTPNVSNYLYKIFRDVCIFNNYIINLFYYGISGLPELAIMTICGLAWHFILIALGVLNFIVVAYYIFAHILDSFNQTGLGEDIVETSSDGWFFKTAMKALMFFMIFGIIMLAFYGVGAVFFTIYCLLIPFFVRFKKSDQSPDKYKKYSNHENIWDFFKDILYFKKIYFLFLTLCSLLSAFVTVGGGKAAAPIVFVGLIVLALGYLKDKSIVEEIVAGSNNAFTRIPADFKIGQGEIAKSCGNTFKECKGANEGADAGGTGADTDATDADATNTE